MSPEREHLTRLRHRTNETLAMMDITIAHLEIEAARMRKARDGMALEIAATTPLPPARSGLTPRDDGSD